MARRSDHRRRGRVRSRLRFLVRGAVALSAVAAVLYVVWLDLEVRSRFEGKRWAVPARIYARPLELYAGMDLDTSALEEELLAAGYRRLGTLDGPGSFVHRGDFFAVHARAFPFWDAAERPRLLRVRVRGGRVAHISKNGAAVDLARIDPALIGRIYPRHHEDRVLVRLEEVPIVLLAALLAVEDRDYMQHRGVSPRAIVRALIANLRAGSVVQGGSTLTQQLAKSFFLFERRTLWRKLNDAIIAVLLEAHFDKKAILEAYVNEVYLGQDGRRAIHGMALGAEFYFGKNLRELRLPEVALLVALVRGPSYYNPRKHPERARARRALVLAQMVDQGVVSGGEAERAREAPLGVKARPRASAPHPAFVDLVRRQLRRDYADEDLKSEGLRIFTTLEPRLQRHAERVLAKRVAALETRTSSTGGNLQGALQGAVIVTSTQSGEVLAVVGGRRARDAGFNRALDAVRPVGSLIKPAIYLTALSRPERYTLASLVLDAPLGVRTAHGDVWRPKNYDGETHGSVPLYQALAHSYNLAAVRLGLEVGLDEIVESLHLLGVRRRLDAFPSLLLGAAELAPVEVTQMYQTLAGGGFRVPLRAIRGVTTARGEPLARYPLSVVQVFDPEPVFLTVEAMRGVMRFGTGRAARTRLGPSTVTAGKTGTTDGLRDSWFAGFDRDRLAVVWLGHDDNTPTGLTGSSGALRVWLDLMDHSGARSLATTSPPGVEWGWADVTSGARTAPDCPGAVRLPFVRGFAPPVGTCAGASELRAGRAAGERG